MKESKYCTSVDHSGEVLEKARKTYEENKHLTKYVQMYYNLHYCESIRHHKSDWLEKELHYPGLRILDQYFLKYIPGAFVRPHSDYNGKVTKTAITLIDAEDLVGGDVIIYEPHEMIDVNTNMEVINEYSEGMYEPGEPIVPVILKQNVGETIEYDSSLMHSVSKVLKGSRTVLVSWYCNQ